MALPHLFPLLPTHCKLWLAVLLEPLGAYLVSVLFILMERFLPPIVYLTI